MWKIAIDLLRSITIAFLGIVGATLLLLSMTSDATISLAYHELGVASLAHTISGGRPERIIVVMQWGARAFLIGTMMLSLHAWWRGLARKRGEEKTL